MSKQNNYTFFDYHVLLTGICYQRIGEHFCLYLQGSRRRMKMGTS